MRAFVAIALLLATSAADAQDRLFSGDSEIGTFGRFGQDIGAAPIDSGWNRLAGGRYLITVVPFVGLEAVDSLTGARRPLPALRYLAFDRARPRVFFGRGEGIWALDITSGIEQLVIEREATTAEGCVHATSIDVLVCAFRRPDGRHDLVRQGAAGAELVATAMLYFPGDTTNTGHGAQWTISPDGARSFFFECVPPVDPNTGLCAGGRLVALDLVSGVMVSALEYQGARLVYDDSRERVYVVGHEVDAYDASLHLIGTAAWSEPCSTKALAISAHTGRIYVRRVACPAGENRPPNSPTLGAFTAFSADTYGVVQPETRRLMRGGPLYLVTAPGAPLRLQANVSGNSVGLTWVNIGASSHYVIEAGLAPGRTDLTFNVDNASPAARFANVPPGTYYVRVRGGNVFGGGKASEEIAVTVR